MKKITTTLLLFLFIAVGVLAQKQPKEYVEEFFENYNPEKPRIALVELFSSNKYMYGEDVSEGLMNVNTELIRLGNMVGQYYGYEIIREATSGSCLCKIVCIVRFDRQPVQFSFTFYKGENEWKIYKFLYSDANIDF